MKYKFSKKLNPATKNYEKPPLTLLYLIIISPFSCRSKYPKNRLGRALFGNLYVYEGSEHKHEAQNPKAIKL